MNADNYKRGLAAMAKGLAAMGSGTNKDTSAMGAQVGERYEYRMNPERGGPPQSIRRVVSIEGNNVTYEIEGLGVRDTIPQERLDSGLARGSWRRV